MTEPPPAVRTFRLHLQHRTFDGWVTATGMAGAIEDQELGLTAAAATVDDLIRGYGGGHLEWLPHRELRDTAQPEQHEGGPR
ncbi:hypothetical protein AB0F46_35260 [Streptomyces sp. NPDC026665]|uniref:hypothetical protein n=1 Tax=Streptomyces sp. NPDC026665 TaxID=3154798 RepID=UPI0033C4CE0A